MDDFCSRKNKTLQGGDGYSNFNNFFFKVDCFHTPPFWVLLGSLCLSENANKWMTFTVGRTKHTQNIAKVLMRLSRLEEQNTLKTLPKIKAAGMQYGGEGCRLSQATCISVEHRNNTNKSATQMLEEHTLTQAEHSCKSPQSPGEARLIVYNSSHKKNNNCMRS